MDCKHERIRCTNNHFFCLDCGQEVPDPFQMRESTKEAERPVETAKKPRKRNVKKEVE